MSTPTRAAPKGVARLANAAVVARFVGALISTAALAGAAAAECRQALALGLDVSGSVNAEEYALQMGGLAAALESPDVVAALLEIPGLPVHLAVFEWSGPGSPRLVVPWTAVDGSEALGRLTDRLRATRRVPSDSSTAIGEAMLYGAALLTERPECLRRTLDLSGDGPANATPRPGAVKEMGEMAGVTVNALAIGVDDRVHGDIRQAEIAALQAYYETEVILGPGAFVETALGFPDFAEAMRRKLLRELEGLSIGGRDNPSAVRIASIAPGPR